MADEPGKRHDVRAHEAEVIADWLNPLSFYTVGQCYSMGAASK